MTGHRYASTGCRALCADRGACHGQIDAYVGLSTRMPRRREAGSGWRGWCRVTRSVYQGHHPYDEIRVPAPARCGRQRSADDAAAAFIAAVWPVIGGAGHGGTGRAARRGGAGPRPGPCFLPAGPQGLQGQACLRVSVHQALFPCAGCPAVTGTLEAGGAAPYPGAARPRPGARQPFMGVSGGGAATFWSWRARDGSGPASPGIRANPCPGPGIAGRGLSHPPGVTPHHGRSRRAPPQAGACGQPGSRTANRMAVPLSPSIRERACPARLRSARTILTSRRTQ